MALLAGFQYDLMTMIIQKWITFY